MIRWTATQPVLASDTVSLRSWRPSDAEQVFWACQDAVIQRFTNVPTPYRRDDATHFIETVASTLWASRSGCAFAIVDSITDDVLGSCGLPLIDGDARLGGIGYWVAAWARRQGVGTRALSLLTTWCLGDLGLERVELQIEAANHSSQALAKAAGYAPTPRVVQEMHRDVLKDFHIWERAAPAL